MAKNKKNKKKSGGKLSPEELAVKKADMKKAQTAKKSNANESVPPPAFRKKVKGIANPLLENSKLKTAIVMVIAVALKDKPAVATAIRESGILFKIKEGVDFDNLEPLNRAEWSGMGYARYGCNEGAGFVTMPKNANNVLKVIPYVTALTGKEEAMKALEAKVAPLAEKAKKAPKAKKAEKAPKADGKSKEASKSGKKKKKKKNKSSE